MQENEKVSIKDRFRAFINPNKRSVDSALVKGFAALASSSDSGVYVNEDTALAFSAVWQARRILSELPASLSIDFFEEKGQNRNAIDHEAKALLLNPNPYMNGFSWMELMNDWLQGWGNGISIIDNRSKGRPEMLMPVHPSYIEAVMENKRVFYKVNDTTTGLKGTFFSEEVVHYKGFTGNGIWGKSPIQMAKENIGLGLAAEKFGARFFKKGGNLKSVIETTGHLGDKEFKEWKRRWDAFYRGEAGDHETPVLEYGMTYKPLGIAPEAAQFLQTRQFSIQDVARWFNLPPHMLGDLSRSTFSNIEHQDIQFVKYTLRPILKRQEIELENKLLLPGERGRIRIRFNIDGLLRGDLASVTQHIKEMVLAGVLSPDEGRALLNRNARSDGKGNAFYTPANIVGKENTPNNGK